MNPDCTAICPAQFGSRLDLDDIRTYCRIVTALGQTIDLQKAIDVLYPEAESKVVCFDPPHNTV